MGRRGIIVICLLAGIPFWSSGAAAEGAGDQENFRLNSVDANMTADEYRQACHSNQRRIMDFVRSYSESTLTGFGVPKQGVAALGAIAGAAVTQEATLYLNSGKSFAIDIKDAAQDDRAIFFAVKHTW